MTINWNNNVNIDGGLHQTECGTLYGFNSNIGANIAIPEILSTSITEIEWIIPFTYIQNSVRTQNLGQRNNDFYLPYFPAGSNYAYFFNGSTGVVASPPLDFNVKYWIKITRNYSNNTVKYEWSTNGITYATYVNNNSFGPMPVSSSDPYIIGNNGGGTEAWDGNIFLSEVKCKVDGVNIPLFTSSTLNWNSGITFNGDVIVSQEGWVSGFKNDTYIELAMPEITGVNPSSTLTYIFPIARTSQCPTTRESQLGWKDKRWIIPKFINNSNNVLYTYNNTTGSNLQVSPALNRNQKYWIKVDWNESTGTRTYSYSPDNAIFSQYASFNDTAMASETPSGPIYIGMGNPNSENNQWFVGELDLANTKIYANGVEVTTLAPSPIIPEGTFNSNDITNAYIGSTQVSRLYLGSNLIYGQ